MRATRMAMVWRIAQECPALRHNSWDAAAVPRGAEGRCVCPRTEELRRRRTASSTRRVHKSRASQGKMPVWWTGPWRIAEECPSMRHHSCRLADRGPKETRCICPRSLSLAAEYARYKNEWRRSTRRPPKPVSERAKPGPKTALPGVPRWYQGPWQLAEECPADGHFSLTYARQPKSGEKCICPRALALLKGHRLRQANAYVRPKAGVTAVSRTRLAEPVVATLDGPPDLSTGLCISDHETADKGFNRDFSHEGMKDRAEAVGLCEICPVVELCRTWVQQEERPAGSWGGVWGGLDVYARQGRALVLDDRGVITKVSISSLEKVTS